LHLLVAGCCYFVALRKADNMHKIFLLQSFVWPSLHNLFMLPAIVQTKRAGK
jgi:hypothetical protein